MIPVHGEYRHMQAHAELARTMGVKDKNVLICEDGDRVTLTDKGLKRDGTVPAHYLYVDGIVGDVGHGVIRDRQVLAEEGVVVVIVTVDHDGAEIVTGPEVITRGWIYAAEAEDLLDEMRALVADAVAGRRSRRATTTSRRCSGWSARRPGSSSATAPSAAR